MKSVNTLVGSIAISISQVITTGKEMYHTVHAPSGKCPANLGGIDEASVHAWAGRVVDALEKTGRRATAYTLRYYARDFYSYHTEEYITVCHHLSSFGDVDEGAPLPNNSPKETPVEVPKKEPEMVLKKKKILNT